VDAYIKEDRDMARLPKREDFNALLHFVGAAFAIENVSRFSGTFTFTPLRLVATADVGANLVAADTLLFWRSDRFFLIFRHCQAPLSSDQQ
jgi:hypothetical protein